MASRDSRLLREGKERGLIVETIKTIIGYQEVNLILKQLIRKQFDIGCELIQTVTLQGFYFGEIKASIVYQDFASEVKEEVYWTDLSELHGHASRWAF